jgi:hypothetical protein
MEQLRARLMNAERPELLRLLAAVIAELTVRGRSYYDSPDAVERLRETNEAIHRVTGHLRDLSDGEAIFTASRADGVMEQIRLLTPSTSSQFVR